jgi:hypothetical protein
LLAFSQKTKKGVTAFGVTTLFSLMAALLGMTQVSSTMTLCSTVTEQTNVKEPPSLECLASVYNKPNPSLSFGLFIN